MNSSSRNEELGRHRRSLRVRAFDTQAAHAEAADVSRATVVAAEKGSTELTLDTLDKLARALGLDLREYERLPDTVSAPSGGAA